MYEDNYFYPCPAFIDTFVLTYLEMDCLGDYYYLDGEIHNSAIEYTDHGAEVSFYEVIRTTNGVPWFFDDHVKRLIDGISTRYTVPDRLDETLKQGINALAEKVGFPEKNIRITVSFSRHIHSVHICFIESTYPAPGMYNEGVRLITYNAERFDPGVKTLNLRLRFSVDEQLKSRNAYEALLVNREGIITEGSRSNLFFVEKDNSIVTPPDNLVLPGITRKHVIDICRENNIKVGFEKIKTSDISLFRSAFISGTSPMVLPVCIIDDVCFIVQSPMISMIRECYIRRAQSSINSYRGKH